MFHHTTLWCGGCGNGLVAFVLAADGKQVVLFCLNCGTWYPSVAHSEEGELMEGTLAEGPDLILPELGCSVRFPSARWATPDEVRAFGWGDYLDPKSPSGNPWLPEEEPWWAERVRGKVLWGGGRKPSALGLSIRETWEGSVQPTIS